MDVFVSTSHSKLHTSFYYRLLNQFQHKNLKRIMLPDTVWENAGPGRFSLD